MAPREASGTFPDQYLTYDYEPSVPLGAPVVHEPFPGNTGGDTTVDEGPPRPTGTAVGAATGNGTGNTAMATAGTTANANHNIGSNSHGNSTHLPHNATPNQVPRTIGGGIGGVGTTTNGNGGSGSSHGNTPVDPLSIDPTASMSSTSLAASSGSTAMATNNSMELMMMMSSSPQLPDLSLNPSTTTRTVLRNHTQQGGGGSTSGSPSSTTLMRPSNMRPSMLFAPLGTTTTVTPTTVSPTTALTAMTGSSNTIPASHTNMDDVPGLDVTYDSVLSATTHTSIGRGPAGPSLGSTVMMMINQSDLWENTHMVEDDQSSSGGSSSPPILSSALSTSSSTNTPNSPSLVSPSPVPMATLSPPEQRSRAVPTSPNSIALSFGPNTTVADLKYFAERGCIVALLQALTTPRLVTLGTRMLADYAKMSHRRVAVASNRKILEFVQQTMLQPSEQTDWLGREYAVETVRSLTATEESDAHLMRSYGLLNTLALVAKGGPFDTRISPQDGTQVSVPLASEKARLHACIAIMNLSCGKSNKIEIAKLPQVLEAMRDVMLHSTDEARLKATTCIKNLSNADANDASLLGTPGLVEALGKVAVLTCTPQEGATPCTTNACLALMNLSISKSNKHRVFRTRGVMEALMAVLERTTAQGSSTEARIKACSALSNLAIGYDNKIPMFHYPGFVDAILNVIQTDTGEARTKACSILWSFAAEMKNQVPVVQRGDILPVLVQVADEDGTTEARFKCVAALTLLAESLENAIPLLESGALAPLMDILHEAGPDPTQWKGQTASWCVGFLMNIGQSDEAVPALREAGVVELLAPLLTLDHYQSLKAAMAVTFVCRYDEGDECYDLLRKTENVIPKIISLLHNTLSGRGGNGYKYGVFTLRSSVGCIAALASGPDFMKERIATGPVFESLLQVLSDFCVDGGTPGAIVGGGRDDVMSATLAVRATQALTAHLIPTTTGCSALPFGQSMEDRLLKALKSFETAPNKDLLIQTRALATDAKIRIEGGRKAKRSAVSRFVSLGGNSTGSNGGGMGDGTDDVDMNDVASMASSCCGLQGLPGFGERLLGALALPTGSKPKKAEIVSSSSLIDDEASQILMEETPVRTFLLADGRTGRRFAVPTDPSGGRAFNDNRVWCYRRGRFCFHGEHPDPNFIWTDQLQEDYEAALNNGQGDDEEEEDEDDEEEEDEGEEDTTLNVS